MHALAERPVASTPATVPPSPPVQRWVWQGRYGTNIIEVRGPDVFVNGQRVIPAAR